MLGIGLAVGDGRQRRPARRDLRLQPARGDRLVDARCARRAQARDHPRLWLAVAVVCALATVVGYAIADVSVAATLQRRIDGFAAGALLVMLIDSMIPDAPRKAGRIAGLVTVLGFAVAAGLSGIA